MTVQVQSDWKSLLHKVIEYLGQYCNLFSSAVDLGTFYDKYKDWFKSDY